MPVSRRRFGGGSPASAAMALAELVAVARERRPVALCARAAERIADARRAVDAIAEAGDAAPAV